MKLFSIPKFSALIALVVICPGVLLWVATIERQGLWADEVFSLAIATGHSLEHPASQARPELGDYSESKTPLAPSEYQRYLQHEDPPAGLTRILRAVLLSDTSPPLYYLLLSVWLRAVGTSDAALRLFSVFWALACFPLMWRLAKETGGRPAVIPAMVLFAVAPVCVYYSTEGRMYSMLWFLVLSQGWLTLKLNRRAGVVHITLWIATASVTRSSSLVIQIEGQVRIEHGSKEYLVAVDVRTMDDILLFRTHNIEQPEFGAIPSKAGTFILKCRLPPDLLPPGIYRLGVHTTIVDIRCLQDFYPVLEFEVIDDQVVGNPFAGSHGLVTPQCRWSQG